MYSAFFFIFALKSFTNVNLFEYFHNKKGWSAIVLRSTSIICPLYGLLKGKKGSFHCLAWAWEDFLIRYWFLRGFCRLSFVCRCSILHYPICRSFWIWRSVDLWSRMDDLMPIMLLFFSLDVFKGAYSINRSHLLLFTHISLTWSLFYITCFCSK